MAAMTPEPAPTGMLTRLAAEELAAELAAEMLQRWRQGERLLPEDLLARHPVLWNHPEAAADLIYEELCLRQEFGPPVTPDEVIARFPQWRPQLEVLFDCQRVLGPRRAAPQFPEAGELVGDFLLLAELGRGGQGRVFLASQQSLGNRPVVLKLIPAETYEHLSLARLQHTHIVPLYSVQDQPSRGLRALCMPYFGGATLSNLLKSLEEKPLAERTGQDLLDALDQAQGMQNESGILSLPASPRAAPARRQLSRATYVEAICWIGICVADALQYTHERDLLHLDLKPSNVLLAADGQPMLLDFHLAQRPIAPDGANVPWFGGTTGYMSPEQNAAMQAIHQGKPVAQPIDRRTDIYSLGVVFYEALAGARPEENPRWLRHCNPQVSPGLADIVAKCLQSKPEARYPDMAALAAELRRHLTHLPLAGVRNRSLVERWRKWRCRKPDGIARASMLLAVASAVVAVALGAASHVTQQVDLALTALSDSHGQIANGDWDGAIRSLRRGQAAARLLPWQPELAAELEQQRVHAEQARAAAERAAARLALHKLAERVRFIYGARCLPPDQVKKLQMHCREFWERREEVLMHLGPSLEAAVVDDLLDVALFWADLQKHLDKAELVDTRQRALTILAQVEALVGPSPVLDEERKVYGVCRAKAKRLPRSVWEHYAVGRALLRAGCLDRATQELEEAIRLEPQGLWPNFYHGQCAYCQGRYADAVTAYSVCIGAAPEAAGCFYNRALAYTALGRTALAVRDYEQAMRLDPTLKVVALNRGLLWVFSQPFARR